MKRRAPTLLMSLACLCPAMAGAQAATDPFFADCPAFSADESANLHWEPLRAPGLLFCRAVRNDGSEAFALTFSRDSPFDPRAADRAELGSFRGQPLQWYRSTVATAPDAIIRETLIDFGGGHVLHVSMRADDVQMLERQQRLVVGLPYPQARYAGGAN